MTINSGCDKVNFSHLPLIFASGNRNEGNDRHGNTILFYWFHECETGWYSYGTIGIKLLLHVFSAPLYEASPLQGVPIIVISKTKKIPSIEPREFFGLVKSYSYNYLYYYELPVIRVFKCDK